MRAPPDLTLGRASCSTSFSRANVILLSCSSAFPPQRWKMSVGVKFWWSKAPATLPRTKVWYADCRRAEKGELLLSGSNALFLPAVTGLLLLAVVDETDEKGGRQQRDDDDEGQMQSGNGLGPLRTAPAPDDRFLRLEGTVKAFRTGVLSEMGRRKGHGR